MKYFFLLQSCVVNVHVTLIEIKTHGSVSCGPRKLGMLLSWLFTVHYLCIISGP